MSAKTFSFQLPYSFQRRHFCSYCGAVYEYTIKGKLEETSTKSEADARKNAENTLKNIRIRSALDKPCPNCGRYSSEALACFSVGCENGALGELFFGGLLVAFASTFFLRVDLTIWSLALALGLCLAILFFLVDTLDRLKRLNATPAENLAAIANNVKLRSDLLEIRTNSALKREVDKSAFTRLEYLRLARLVFPAFAVLYFFGRGIGALESETLSDESVKQFWFAIIGTATLLAVFEAMARKDKARFQGKLPLALDNSQSGDAKGARPRVEAVFEAGNELARSKTRLMAGLNATFSSSVDALSTADVKVASRSERDAGETETLRRAFASLGEQVERAETGSFAPKRQTPNEKPKRSVAVEVKAAETEDVERERKLDAEERRERERLRKYDASPSRLSKYDR